MCSLALNTRHGHWQIWVRVSANDGRVLEDPARSWLSRYINQEFPRWQYGAREQMHRDRYDGSILWAYVCPADAQSDFWCEQYLD